MTAKLPDCGEVRLLAREAVAQFLEDDGRWTTGYVAKIRSGEYDRSELIANWERGYLAGIIAAQQAQK